MGRSNSRVNFCSSRVAASLVAGLEDDLSLSAASRLWARHRSISAPTLEPEPCHFIINRGAPELDLFAHRGAWKLLQQLVVCCRLQEPAIGVAGPGPANFFLSRHQEGLPRELALRPFLKELPFWAEMVNRAIVSSVPPDCKSSRPFRWLLLEANASKKPVPRKTAKRPVIMNLFSLFGGAEFLPEEVPVIRSFQLA